MDKSAQGRAREGRLAQALRSNLRRRKAADTPAETPCDPVRAPAGDDFEARDPFARADGGD